MDRTSRSRSGAPPALRQPAFVSPRLRALLSRGLDAGVLLVQAPAGCGKTVTALQFLFDEGVDFRWYACSDDDVAPPRLLAGIAHALGAGATAAGQTTLTALAAGDGQSYRPAIKPLLDEITAGASPAVLVVDDADAVTASPAANDALDYLLGQLEGRVRVVLISRAELRLPSLARRLLDERAVRISGEDLLLREDEIAACARVSYGAELGPRDTAALHRITAGWAIALRLALRVRDLGDRLPAGEGMLFTPDARADLFAYLAAEVLERIDPRVQRFLRATAVLDVLDPEVCAEMTGEERAAEIIQSLAGAGLPVIKAGWASYRCHSLLREYLLSSLTAKESRAAHAAAAAALSRAGYDAQALPHFVAGRDIDSALALIDRRGRELCAAGHARDVLDLVKRADPALLARHPGAERWAARAASRVFEWEWATAALERAHAASVARGEMDDGRAALWSLAHMLNLWGRFGPAAEAARRLIETFPQDHVASRAAASLAHLVPGMTGGGQFRAAVELIRASLPRLAAEPRASANDETLARAVAAVTLAREGDFAEARAQLNLAGALLPSCTDDVVRTYVPWSRALVSFLACDPDAAEAAAHEGERVALQVGDLQRVLECRAMLAMLALVRGDAAGAERGFAAVQELGAGAANFWMTILTLLGRPRLLLLKGDRASALAAAESNHALAAGVGEAWFVCFSRIDLACLRTSNGEHEAALAHARAAVTESEALAADLLRYAAQLMLAWSSPVDEPAAMERALDIAEARDYTFLLPYTLRLPPLDAALWRALAGPRHARAAILLTRAGPATAGVLRQVAPALPPAAATRAVAVLESFGAAGRAGLREIGRSPAAGPSAAARAALAALDSANPHSLSAREAEVLALLRDGLRTKQIAERLALSAATVSTHIERIMAKTRTASRAELLALAAREAADSVK